MNRTNARQIAVLAAPATSVATGTHAGVVAVGTALALLSTAGCARTYDGVTSAHANLIAPADATIDEHPDHADVLVRRERVMEVSASCAYDTIADIEHWSRWDSTVERSYFVEGDHAEVGAVFYQDLGDFDGNARILAAERGHVLRWRGHKPSGSGPVGVHTWTFVPQPDGTTLVINDEHFHAWYLRPLGWVSDLGISEQFDGTLAQLEREARTRC